MRFSNHGRLRQQVRFLRRQYLQDGTLPFSDILTDDLIGQALAAVEGVWKDRIYTPLITLWVFLSQVLSPDHSCRRAVARLIAHRLSQGQPPCSLETGAYCQARMRLPEKFFSAVTRLVGRALDAKASSKWLWKGRRVYMFDGTTVNMPDTPANQKAYPQAYNQKPGLGFPIARVGALTSLSCGAILNLGICRYAGKGQGEVSLLRQLWDVLCPGDVLLTDRLMASWMNIFLLKQRGIEFVTRLNKAHRKADFRRGKRLERHDHIVRWCKPSFMRSLDRETYHKLPEYVTIREALVRVTQPGFRTKTIVIVTTLLDHLKTTREDLATLYRARWNNELDLRSLKCTLQMDRLRCQTPEQVRKEVWTHMLAYNLIRTIMAQAAASHGMEPRTISFKGACQMLEAFQPLIELQAAHDSEYCLELYHHLLDAIASQRVADRPDRFEPRMKKQRPDHYRGLMRPRAEVKRLMAKGFRNI
jgi:DDE family transposase